VGVLEVGEALGNVWLVVAVSAIVVGILGATVVLLEILDRTVDALRAWLLARSDALARHARRLRLPLAAMLPSVMLGPLAGVTTESLIVGVITVGVIAAAMMSVLLALSR
jgi:hypothetical protein